MIVVIALAGVICMVNRDNGVSLIVSTDPKNISYSIDGEEVTLKDGKSEVEVTPGSASKIITQYFGNELVADLDNDGREDKVFLLTQNSGGSGEFFYVVAALNRESGYVGSDGYLLGDRVAPKTIEVSLNPQHKNVIVANYADRAPGESMTVSPSVGKSVYLKLDLTSMQWGIVESDFEGEANPAQMSLSMKTWTWVSALYNDGRELRPVSANAFTVTFGADGKFTATTDCNSVGGSYTADSSDVSFSDIYSTKMYCEGSQESEFLSLIENTQGYHFTSKGELVFDLKFDSGILTFR